MEKQMPLLILHLSGELCVVSGCVSVAVRLWSFFSFETWKVKMSLSLFLAWERIKDYGIANVWGQVRSGCIVVCSTYGHSLSRSLYGNLGGDYTALNEPSCCCYVFVPSSIFSTNEWNEYLLIVLVSTWLMIRIDWELRSINYLILSKYWLIIAMQTWQMIFVELFTNMSLM